MSKRLLLSVLVASWMSLAVTGTRAAGPPLVPVGDEPYRWVYDYIRSLQLRGRLLDLNPAVRPYSRWEVARSLLELETELASSGSLLREPERGMVRRLNAEFSKEMRSFGSKVDQARSYCGADLRAVLEVSESKSPRLWETLWLKAGAELNPHLCIYGGFVLDRRLAQDSSYTGKVWRDLTALTDRAGFNLSYGKLRLQLGRERHVWGLSRIESLLLSSDSFPIDQGYLDLRLGPLLFSSFAGALSAEGVAPTEGEESTHINRYLSGHRVDLDINPHLHLGLSETVVYGGPGRDLEFYYLNPLVWYHLAQLNENRDDNTFFAVDLLLRPLRGVETYGELLIDDFQVENQVPGDREPDHYGCLVGIALAELLGLHGAEIFGEYLRITNWTYNQKYSWNRYQNRGRPIGNSLGPDADRWDLGLSIWIQPPLQVTMVYTRLRSGEGRIDSEWDQPWLSASERSGEDFPSGVVQTTSKLVFQAYYHSLSGLQFKLNLDLHRIKNLNHQPSPGETHFSLELTAIYSFIS